VESVVLVKITFLWYTPPKLVMGTAACAQAQESRRLVEGGAVRELEHPGSARRKAGVG